jgi:hypothetical protein
MRGLKSCWTAQLPTRQFVEDIQFIWADIRQNSFLFTAVLLSITLFFLPEFVSPARAAAPAPAEIPDPGAFSNPEVLLSLPDGPTVSDSPCVFPSGHVLLELQYAHENLRGGGAADVYMQATEVRLGLPGRNEFKVLTPSYTVAKESSGLSATSIGFKHELGYNDKWVGSVEAILTLPSGNDAFGSAGLGAAFNGIVGYSLSDQFGLGLQLGVSTWTDPALAGGRRFTSFNPIFVATWHPMERLQFYGEVYGQTKTASVEGAGFNFDGGVQYLIAHWWEVDLTEGVRLTGKLGGLTHYLQAGMKFLF